MSVKDVFRYMEAVESPTGPATTDARAIAMVIARRSHEGFAWLTREEIGDAVLLGVVATKRAIAVLKSGGWVTEENGPRKPRWSIVIPDERPDALEASRERRRRTLPEGSTAQTLGDQRRRPLPKASGSTAQTLGDQRRRPLGINGADPTPPGSPPKTTPAELPHQRSEDLVTNQKLIPPDGVAPREPAKPSAPKGAILPLPGFEVPPAAPTDPLQAAEVSDVLEHWRSRGYHTRKPIDNAERRKRIRARLDDGLDVATIKAAIDGASIDDWLMGRHERNDVANGGKVYNGLETILRDAAQVEKLATLWDVALAEERVLPDGGDRHFDRFGVPRPPPPKPTPEELAERAEAQREAMAFLSQLEGKAAERKAAEQAERVAAEARRVAKLTPEERADEDMLRATAERAKARWDAELRREMN